MERKVSAPLSARHQNDGTTFTARESAAADAAHSLSPTLIKTVGYLVSTLSVLLLGIVSWQAARRDGWLMACLVGGMVTSVLGMLLRWISYRLDD